MKSRSTQNSHLLLYNLLSITNIHLLVFIKKKYHEKHPIMFFFFRNVLRSCHILWTTTYTIYGENDFMSQEQHLTCVRFCFVFVWVFFQHQMRGDDLNLLPIISPIFLYLQRNTDNSAFFLFRAARLRTSACASCIIPPQSAWP